VVAGKGSDDGGVEARHGCVVEGAAVEVVEEVEYIKGGLPIGEPIPELLQMIAEDLAGLGDVQTQPEIHRRGIVPDPSEYSFPKQCSGGVLKVKGLPITAHVLGDRVRL